MILAHTTSWWLDPLWGAGYQFWSGIGSDVGEVALISGVYVLLRRHNCHVSGCWRLQFHPHPKHGHPVCKKHYGEDGSGHDLS